MNKKTIDLNTYARKDHFLHFLNMVNPYTGVTVDVDVKPLYDYCRKNNHSFYLAFVHAVALAANRVPQLRQRIHDGSIVEYDTCGTSHIELLDDETYCYCNLMHDMDWEEYFPYAEKQRRLSREANSIVDEDVEGLYFISALPWVHYSELLQPYDGKESNPRISWGKYEKTGDKMMMPVSIMVHHSLADGLHIGRFYEYLEEEINRFFKENCI